MTEKGKALLMQLEGFRPKVYRDVAGILSIGYGHVLTKDERASGKIRIGCAVVRYADGLTQDQAAQLMDRDLCIPGNLCDVLDFVDVPLNPNQADALEIFTFNVGIGAFLNSTLLRELNLGDYDAVPAQLRRWVYSAGRKVAGLANRREAEIKLWNTPI